MSITEAANFILEKWDRDISILIAVNIIATSIQLYNTLKEKLAGQNIVLLEANERALNDPDRAVLCYLSTNLIPKERLRRISKLKELLSTHRKVLVVST